MSAKQLMDFAIESLKQCPNEWVSDGYYVRNPRLGIAVMIVAGPDRVNLQLNDRILIGSVINPLGFFVPWRRKLFTPFYNFAKAQKKSQLESEIEAALAKPICATPHP